MPRSEPQPPAKPKPRRGLKPENLSLWLDIATWAIVPSAEARVRAEIEAHYAEAVKARLESGLTEQAAQMAALGDLGNPYAAARRFRRGYLTRFDRTLISANRNTDRSFAKISFILAVFAILALAAGDSLRWEDGLVIFMTLLTFIPAEVACWVLARRKPTVVNVRRFLLARSISNLIASVSFLVLAWFASREIHLEKTDAPLPPALCGFWILIIVAAQNMSGFLFCLHQRRKLRSANDDDLNRLDPA